MDPVSQAALGAAIPQAVGDRQRLAPIALVGALAGMAPDLDVLIRSSTDPLLFLVYHRQFTHSLVFIPFGALICTLALWPLVKRWLDVKTAFWAALLGYGSHGLLDACTTYGTLLFWPFSNQRIAWNTVSVIDPLFTLPLLLCVLIAARTRQQSVARWGLLWGIVYLSMGLLQSHRAESVGYELAQSRGHKPAELSAKPSLANLLLWKVVYEYDGRFYVDAVRVGLETRVYPGSSVERLQIGKHLPWLSENSQQAHDIERFRWFSSDYLAIDQADPLLIVDMRYSMLPNEIEGLWGIRLNPDAGSSEHVQYHTQRSASRERIDRLLAMLLDSEYP